MMKDYSDNLVQYVIRYGHKHPQGMRFFEVILYAKHMFDASDSLSRRKSNAERDWIL